MLLSTLSGTRRVLRLNTSALPRHHSPSLRTLMITADQQASTTQWLQDLSSLKTHETDLVSLNKTRQLSGTLPGPGAGRLLCLGDPLPPAWHLVFFNPEHHIETLRPDGTENGAFFPPKVCGPMERMWAGGVMEWVKGNEVKVGEELECCTTVDRYEVKEGKRGPMYFVYQKRVVSNAHGPALTEIRNHMYRRPFPDPGNQPSTPPKLPQAKSSALKAPYVIPSGAKSEKWSYTPNMIHLFRFSALTFNSHRIHYDREYCTTQEHRPDCVVHGPLTALLLCETLYPTLSKNKKLHIDQLNYRALNPLYVNREVGFSGYAVVDGEGGTSKREKWPVWAVDDGGVLSMSAEVVLSQE